MQGCLRPLIFVIAHTHTHSKKKNTAEKRSNVMCCYKKMYVYRYMYICMYLYICMKTNKKEQLRKTMRCSMKICTQAVVLVYVHSVSVCTYSCHHYPVFLPTPFRSHTHTNIMYILQ